MPLMDSAAVKNKFELWQKYCTIPNSGKTPDQVLDDKILDADAEFLEYLTVDETTISDIEKRHYMAIVRYNCFRIKHGNQEFQQKPQIVRDYENTIKTLSDWKHQSSTGANQDLPAISAKDRRFGKNQWFTGDA